MERAVVATLTDLLHVSTARTVQSVWLPNERISLRTFSISNCWLTYQYPLRAHFVFRGSKMMSDHRILLYLVNILIFNIVLVICDPQELNHTKDYVTFMSNKLELLSQNEKVILNLMDYLDQLKERLDGIRRLTSYLSQPVRAAKGREKEFLSNPLNVYSLLRQSESDWTQVLRYMEQPIGQEQINYMREMHNKRPEVNSVRDSMTAIHRIKEVYKLKSSDLVRGIIEGVQYNAKLSVLDCYEMGFMYYNASHFKRTEEWLITARELMNRPKSNLYPALGVTPTDISSLLAKTYVAMGNYSLASQVLLEDPELSSSAEKWLKYFKENSAENVKIKQLIEFNALYSKLCSSAYKPKPSRLVCFYKTNPSPFLLLAPFKTEQLSVDPLVVVFHDVVYSSEIAVLEERTEPLLKRGVVLLKDGTKKASENRTVSRVWLPNSNLSTEVNSLVHRIRLRVRDMTGLIIDDHVYNSVQLINYGFGGHFGFHFDFLNVTGLGHHCISTVLFYLNDVVRGGATIFPKINLAVKPERGKVLYFYNFVRGSYDYDLLSAHGACPVIIGNKLAITQCIYERNQMFLRPCWKPPQNRKYE